MQQMAARTSLPPTAPASACFIGALLFHYNLRARCECLLLQFENESRRVSMGAGLSEPTSVRNKTPLFERSYSEPVGGPHDVF